MGFLPEEMPRMAPFATVHPQDLDRLQRHFNQLLRGEPVPSIQVRMLHKTGRHIWLEMMWRAVMDEVGQVVQLQVSSRDITDSKQNERRLEDAQKKLRQQQDMLQDVNNKLSEMATSDGLTQLCATVARSRSGSRTKRVAGGVTAATVSLILLDIDHFKSFNDTYGHPKGDEVLRVVGAILRASLRAGGLRGSLWWRGVRDHPAEHRSRRSARRGRAATPAIEDHELGGSARSPRASAWRRWAQHQDEPKRWSTMLTVRCTGRSRRGGIA